MTLLSDAPVRGVQPSVRADLLAPDLPMGRQREDLPEAAPTVDVHGPLELATLPRVRAALDDALVARPQHLVVDLADCPHVDASALAVLLQVHRRMSRYGGRLTLRSASPRVVRVLSLTGLRHVFDLG